MTNDYHSDSTAFVWSAQRIKHLRARFRSTVGDHVVAIPGTALYIAIGLRSLHLKWNAMMLVALLLLLLVYKHFIMPSDGMQSFCSRLRSMYLQSYTIEHVSSEHLSTKDA